MEKKKLLKIIGKNIQIERQAKGLTQETFAELMGVSWSYVSKIESGIINLSIGKINEIANYLNIKVYKLFNIEEK